MDATETRRLIEQSRVLITTMLYDARLRNGLHTNPTEDPVVTALEFFDGRLRLLEDFVLGGGERASDGTAPPSSASSLGCDRCGAAVDQGRPLYSLSFHSHHDRIDETVEGVSWVDLCDDCIARIRGIIAAEGQRAAMVANMTKEELRNFTMGLNRRPPQ